MHRQTALHDSVHERTVGDCRLAIGLRSAASPREALVHTGLGACAYSVLVSLRDNEDCRHALCCTPSRRSVACRCDLGNAGVVGLTTLARRGLLAAHCGWALQLPTPAAEH